MRRKRIITTVAVGIEIYRYILTETGYSSSRFGPCEICGEHVSDEYIQREQRRCYCSAKQRYYWTYNGMRCHFGHKKCLQTARKIGVVLNKKRLSI
jgi:hypothetical protein